MRGGWIGFVGGSILLLLAAGVRGEEESLFLNGDLVRLEAPGVRREAGFLIPLREFGALVGVEVAVPVPGSFELRWSGGRLQTPAAELPSENGVAYASLDWLVGLAGGDVHRLGDDVFVTSEPSTLVDLDVNEDRIVLRFDAFVPVEVLAADGGSFRLRFHHCDPSFPYRAVVLADGPMTRVEARSCMPSGLELLVTLREGGVLRLTRFEATDSYAVTIEVGASPSIESVTAIAPDQELRELTLPLSGGTATVVSATVNAWRSTYRLRPGVSPSTPGALTGLTELAIGGSAKMAIGAGADLGLLVIGGVPLSVTSEEETLLTSDAFGRLSPVSGTGRVVLRVEGADIPIDDVNRPVRYNEAIAFPPGYRGEMSVGATGGFTVLKLRAGQVVSIYQGTFVDQDSTATLIIASGEARARLANVRLGDAARLACYVGTSTSPIENALSIESVLLQDGVRRPSQPGRSDEESRAWSVVATDWHGGLIFLSIRRGTGSAGATADEVIDLLARHDVPLKDAYVLDAGSSSSLLVTDRGLHPLGDSSRVAVALLLCPIAP